MHTFSGGRRTNFLLGVFHEGIFHEEGSFQGVNLSGEIIHNGNLPEFLYKILFTCLAFSFPSQFYEQSG